MPRKSRSNIPKVKKSPPIHIKVINESIGGQQSESDSSGRWDSEPKRPFSEMMDIIDADPRLSLSNESYVQMIMGKGLVIKSKKKRIEKKLKEWFDEINLEDKVEDGLHSYCGAGNLFWEVEPKFYSDCTEVPIDTMVGITRDKFGDVKLYHQYVNNKDKTLDPETIIQFKFTNARKELWGRGLFHSLINDFTDPTSNITYKAPIFAMKDLEDGLVKIIQNYAAPIQMFYFKDAGPAFIEKQGDSLKKARPGAKILTDKEFEIKNFEVKGDSKFDKYIEHIQRDVIEPGSKLPLQFFNAGFTARAASETSDNVVIRKVKRIQKRFANELKEKFVHKYAEKIIKGVSKDDYDLFFEFSEKVVLDVIQMVTLYRDNGIRRSELRKALVKSTDLPIDQEDMEDLPPITSVTPTNDLGNDEGPRPIPQRDPTDSRQQTKMEIESGE